MKRKESFHSLTLRIQNETSPRPSYSEACKIASRRSVEARKRKKARIDQQKTDAKNHLIKLEQMKLF